MLQFLRKFSFNTSLRYCLSRRSCNLYRNSCLLGEGVSLQTMNYSTGSEFEKSSWVVLSDDGNTIVSWHPEQQFPYEYSKAIPRFEPELNECDSVLKVQYRLDHKHRHHTDLTIEELQKITHTTKHIWYPNSQKRKRNPNPPIDREGI